MPGPGTPKKTLRTRLWCLMYDRGWTRSELDDTLRSRIARAIYDWRQWYDWGNPVMWLVGRYDGGSAGVPRGRDLWYIDSRSLEHVTDTDEYQLLSNLPRRGRFLVTNRYDDVRRTRRQPWKILDVQDDGHTVNLGYYGERLAFYGLDRAEMRLLLRWHLIDCRLKAEWLGLRRWVYYRALHAAVAKKIPFRCQVTPARGSGGYSHWHCQLKKRHRGAHRFNAYTWTADSHVDHVGTDACR